VKGRDHAGTTVANGRSRGGYPRDVGLYKKPPLPVNDACDTTYRPII